MTVHSQYIFENLMYVHKNKHKFKKNCDVHNRNTRNKDKLAIPTSRLRTISNSWRGNCVNFYNKLPINFTSLSINKFKSIVKRKLICKAYYCINDYINDKKAWD